MSNHNQQKQQYATLEVPPNSSFYHTYKTNRYAKPYDAVSENSQENTESNNGNEEKNAKEKYSRSHQYETSNTKRKKSQAAQEDSKLQIIKQPKNSTRRSLDVKKNTKFNSNNLYVPFAIIDNANITKNGNMKKINHTNNANNMQASRQITNKQLESSTIDRHREQPKLGKIRKNKILSSPQSGQDNIYTSRNTNITNQHHSQYKSNDYETNHFNSDANKGSQQKTSINFNTIKILPVLIAPSNQQKLPKIKQNRSINTRQGNQLNRQRLPKPNKKKIKDNKYNDLNNDTIQSWMINQIKVTKQGKITLPNPNKKHSKNQQQMEHMHNSKNNPESQQQIHQSNHHQRCGNSCDSFQAPSSTLKNRHVAQIGEFITKKQNKEEKQKNQKKKKVHNGFITNQSNFQSGTQVPAKSDLQRSKDLAHPQPYFNQQQQKLKLRQLQIFQNLDVSLLKTIKFKQSTYYGEVNDQGLRSGRGAIFYSSGKIYQGMFQNDKKEGIGCQIYPDNSSYKGEFKEGKKNGRGRFQWPNGEVYDGQWENGLKHGSGLWEWNDSTASYLGQWKKGQISGFGILTNDKGQRYQGEFARFSKHGNGIYRFANGDKLVGTFAWNMPNGPCEYYWQNGDFFKGYFVNGLRHGKGILSYIDGSYFQGQFRNDKKCGLGLQKYIDETVYFGNFQNDLRHGYGKLTYEDIIYYEGYWLNNAAVLFQCQQAGKQKPHNESIIENDNDSLEQQIFQNDNNGLGSQNKLQRGKLKKLQKADRQKIIKSMKNHSKFKKTKIQKFPSNSVFQRLYHYHRKCDCCDFKIQQKK